MLGQQKNHTVPEWSFILIAVLLLLVAVSLFVRMGGTTNLNVFERPEVQPQTSTEALAKPAVETLRAAKPDFAGGFVPDSTVSHEPVSVEILRAAKPDFAGGFVPDSTMGD